MVATYDTRTFVSEADPVEAYRAHLHDLLVAHPAWEFVGSTTNTGATTYPEVWVYKCLGSVNGWGQDWFLLIGTQVNQPYLRITCAQSHNLAVDRFSHGPRISTLALDSTGKVTNSIDMTWYSFLATQLNTLDTSFTAVTLVTSNGIWAHTNPNNVLVYLGLFEPFNEVPYTTDNDPPIVMLGSAAGNASAVTKRPTSPAGSFINALSAISISNSMAWTNFEGSIPSSTFTYFGNRALGSRKNVGLVTAHTTGVRLGLLPGCLHFNTDAGVSIGDTVDVDGVSYVYFGFGNWLDLSQD